MGLSYCPPKGALWHLADTLTQLFAAALTLSDQP
jgi:hypothetical protein